MAKTDFSAFYTDLPDSIADKLRSARLKPEQIRDMADGEILTLEGIGDVSLEQIREKYPAKLKEVETTPIKQAKKTKKVAKTKETTASPQKAAKAKRIRSQRYSALLGKIDKTKLYPVKEALELLVSRPKPTTVELHLNVTEAGLRGEASLPHSTGKQAKIAIFTPSLLAKIKAEDLDFDILLATPADMPQLAPLAKILGPKGLMPNPKNKTVTDDPQKRKQQLEQGSTLAYKTETKFPLIHLNLGKSNQKAEHLLQNINAILNSIGSKKIDSAFLTTTQSPSIKLELEEEK